jgi:hypothetical protein
MKLSSALVNALAVIGVVAALSLLAAGGAAVAGELGDNDSESTPAGSTTPASTTPRTTPALEVDGDDQPLTATETDRVAAAAELIAGAGATVVEVDRSDDLGEAYEVEVMTPQGELDIALDERLGRVPNLRYDD